MPKTVEGYVLDTATAAGIASVPVTLYSAVTNAALTGAQALGLTTNPTNTDGNGHFRFTMDLSPGPLYADAAIPGGNHDRRYGLETMQVGDHWMSDIGALLSAFTDGIVSGYLNGMAVTVSGSINQFTVATGHALVQGYTWTLESGSFSKTISANTTLTNRRGIVVLRQYIGGSYQGKQEIDILYGTSSGVDPTVRQNVTVGSDVIWEFPLARLNTAQNASVSTILADLRVNSTLGMTIYDGGLTVVGGARGIDFSGNSFIITDEGSGVGLVTPSFGSGAADFKPGNYRNAGIVKSNVHDHSATPTNIGNVAEVQLANPTITLDPTMTYDAVVTGYVNCSTSDANIDQDCAFYVRCSLDAPFNQAAFPTGGSRAGGTYNFAADGWDEWVAGGVTGVSSIKAYLFVRGLTPDLNVLAWTHSVKFIPRG